MPKKQPQLAKLTRPRLYKAVARERLFSLLDEKREHPVVWIAGPPGAGKTTLVASYLEEAGVPAVWYQVDPGDSDPATFFLYLKQAVENLSRGKRKSLPLLTPEYLSDLPGFARRFLRDAFLLLSQECIIVFDNYHEAASRSTLHDALARALGELPPNANIIFISRTDAPPEYAGMVLNGTIVDVRWTDLRLTESETSDIARQRGLSGEEIARALHQRSNGWIAGVVLLAERGISESVETFPASSQSMQTIFNYFAGMAFNDVDPEAQDVLMRAALLPRVTARAVEEITGSADAIQHIENLHLRHLFTDRVPAAVKSYRFHGLFQTFLQTCASERIPDAERAHIMWRAAAIFEQEGAIEDAFALNVSAMQWDTAERQFVGLAPQLIAQGRWQTMQDWGESFPEPRKEANPWLTYWLGKALIEVDAVAAKDRLEGGYQRFVELDDGVGQLLSAAAVIEALYYEYNDFHDMDIWLERIAGLMACGIRLRAPQEELSVQIGIVLAGTCRCPGHAMLRSAVDRVIALLDDLRDDNAKMAAAIILNFYTTLSLDEKVMAVVRELARSSQNSPTVAPIRSAFYLTTEGYLLYILGRYGEAIDCFEKADDIVDAHGLAWATRSFGLWRALCERRMGRLDAAESTLDRVGNLRRPGDRYFASVHDFASSILSFDRGNADRAISMALGAKQGFDAGGQANARIMFGLGYAYMLIASDRLEQAGVLLEECRSFATGTMFDNIIGAIALNQAWSAHKRGAWNEREALLAEALREGRKNGARARLRWYSKALETLLPIAFEKDMETAIAAVLVTECGIVPADSCVGTWPWPVKISTLGNFELRLHEAAPEYSRKQPKKVLALLKAIVAFGSVEVPEKRLMSALWPEEEGDAAHRSLTATLHRLRKLLGNPETVRQIGGELTLNTSLCWVDAIAFERLVDGQSSSAGNLELAIGIYGGSFLSQQEDEPWAVSMRERLRAKFVLAIGKAAGHLESANCHDQAIALYQRGINADPLVENFYQGLMRSYDRLDRRTEAASAYRRLRQTLSVTLGIQPSMESRQLFESLRAG